MARVTRLSSPMLLGFEDIESLIKRASQKSGDGFPPYNIERLPQAEDEPERLRITLAVAGFAEDDLDVTVEDRKLMIRGRQTDDDKDREYIYRGIAARQFQRSFVLADGMEVRSAELENGMLQIDLVRLVPDRLVRRIEIGSKTVSS